MLFNSATFFVFLIIVFVFYCKTAIYKYKLGKLESLINSYIFMDGGTGVLKSYY